MVNKTKDNKKRQVMFVSICLFVIFGSAAGSICYNIFSFPRLTFVMDIFSKNENIVYMFLTWCAIPYCIFVSSFFSWGISVSLFLTAAESFICSWQICEFLKPEHDIPSALKNIPPYILILAVSICVCFYSLNAVASKFIYSSKYKGSLKREKVRKNLENIIVFSCITITIFLYCILKQKIILAV